MPAQTDPRFGLLERFRRALSRPASFAPSDFGPRCVYHYTTAVGLAGILADKAMRATNFSFLNDPSEVQYGRGLADDVLRDAQRTFAPHHNTFFDQVAQELNVETLSEVYVCCFTRLQDDLSQWRAYGSSTGERYAIGFDPEALEELVSKAPNAAFDRVLYDEIKQREELRFILAKAVAFIEREQPEQRSLFSLATFAASHLAGILPILKNVAYEREEEWRIVLWDEGTQEVKFDVTRGILRPYLPFPLSSPPPLRELHVLAPTRREVALKAANLLLKSAGIDYLNAQHSRIPFAE